MTTNIYTNGQTIIDLEDIPVRDVWEHEARDFTPWLAENISRLSREINMELTVLECEKSVGPFSADIYAEDEHGNKVVIENQLERTDHDHIGKMITYAAGLNAQTMIWIADKARPEHAKAIDWLNEMNNNVNFYLIEILTHRIDVTNVTIDFRVVCGPNDVTEAIKTDYKSIPIRNEKYIEFWTQLKDKDTINNLLLNRKAIPKEYFEIQSIIPKTPWKYYIKKEYTTTGLYIYDNKELYKSILLHKEEIENDFGESLIWDNKEDNKSCQIYSIGNIGGLNDVDKWDEIQYDLIDRMLRFQSTIKKHLE